jgi:hypothetical protein
MSKSPDIALTYDEFMKKLEKRLGTNNSTVDDRERRQDLNCSYCRPNRGENQKCHRKHGKTKARHKDKRRGR